MYEIFCKSVTSHALGPPPLAQTVTPSRTPLERDVLYGRPLITHPLQMRMRHKQTLFSHESQYSSGLYAKEAKYSQEGHDYSALSAKDRPVGSISTMGEVALSQEGLHVWFATRTVKTHFQKTWVLGFLNKKN